MNSSSKSVQFSEDIGAPPAGGPSLEAARQSPSRSRRDRQRRAEARLRLLLVKDGVALASHRGGPRHSPSSRFSRPTAATCAPRTPSSPAAEAWHCIPVLASEVLLPQPCPVAPPLLEFVFISPIPAPQREARSVVTYLPSPSRSRAEKAAKLVGAPLRPAHA